MNKMKILPALILPVFSPLLMAEAEFKPLMADDKSRPARSLVLLLGDGITPEAAGVLQKRMEDRITVYVGTAKVGSGEDIVRWISGAGEKTVRSRKWDAIYLAPGAVLEESRKKEIEGKLEPISGAVVWGEGGSEGISSEKLTKALLRNGEHLARWPASEKRDPAKLLAEDGLLDRPEALPVLPSETSTVFRAEEGEWQFNLHSFIARHDGKFWAIWSSGRKDEDSSSQFIRYATSEDGQKWSESGTMAPDPDGGEGPLRWLASGLYEENGNLYGLGCLNTGSGKRGVWGGAKLHRFRWEGAKWVDEGVFGDNAMVYFPPFKVAGRDFFVWRDERAHFFTARSTGEPGKWDIRKHPSFPPDYRMSETGSYQDADGVIHLIIRDQGKTKRLYRSLSFDSGETWTLPVKTNYPDAVSKNFAGRLEDGRFFLINNPRTSGSRDPLVISFSPDGWIYGGPRILRKDAPARRYEGKFKNALSFQYSDAMEHDGRLWVIYSTNKEDIEISSFSIGDFPK